MSYESSSISPVSKSMSEVRGFRSAQKETKIVESVRFSDVLNAFNPLKHLPFINNFAKSDDNPVSPVARLVSGALFGGPIGLAISAADMVFKEATGNSIAGATFQSLFGPKTSTSETQQATQRYQSIADAHKRHPQSWRI